jgi:hypothetical protein
VSRAIGKMTARDRDQRYASAAEAVRALEAVLKRHESEEEEIRGLSSAARPSAAASEMLGRFSGRAAAVGAAVLAAVLLVALWPVLDDRLVQLGLAVACALALAVYMLAGLRRRS